MSRPEIATADPEVAAATLADDLDAFWASGRPDAEGWDRFQLDPLRWIVTLPATTSRNDSMHFFVRLDGRCYDLWPPDVHFVDPESWKPVSSGRWWPATDPAGDDTRPAWFGLHPTYDFQDGNPRPLVCFSFALGYYESDHSPSAEVRWLQGKHTVAASLSRVAEILSPTYFRGGSQ